MSRTIATATMLKVVALAVVMFACFAGAGSLIRQPGNVLTPEEQQRAGMALIVVCLLDTLVLTHVILRSRWSGWRLVLTTFVVFFGVMTFMSQIETAVFVPRMPEGTLPRLFLMGFLVAGPFSALAVPILGRMRSVDIVTAPPTTPMRRWVWRVGVLATVYAALYFTFGYVVAWRDPAVRAFYGGVDRGSFVAHMAGVVQDTFWLVPFQIGRGVLWALIAILVVRAMRASWQETALAIGLLFAVLMNSLLLIPNPFMPADVRMTHLLETASSNFIFGVLAGYVLTRPADAHDGALPVA